MTRQNLEYGDLKTHSPLNSIYYNFVTVTAWRPKSSRTEHAYTADQAIFFWCVEKATNFRAMTWH
jgi:hypothetical protein